MYPRIPRERVADPLVSAEHTLGTTGLMPNLLVRTYSNLFYDIVHSLYYVRM